MEMSRNGLLIGMLLILRILRPTQKDRHQGPVGRIEEVHGLLMVRIYLWLVGLVTFQQIDLIIRWFVYLFSTPTKTLMVCTRFSAFAENQLDRHNRRRVQCHRSGCECNLNLSFGQRGRGHPQYALHARNQRYAEDNAVFDYETNASTYIIRVQAKDEFNASVEGNFTVTLFDVYEDTDGDGFRDSLEASTESDLNDPNSTPLQQGLIAWYPFDGNASDMSGNGNHGTVNGATLTTNRHGQANMAYSFDGTSWIEAPHSELINFSQNESFTFSLWCKVDNFVTSGDILEKWVNSLDPYPFSLRYSLSSSDQLTFAFHDVTMLVAQLT